VNELQYCFLTQMNMRYTHSYSYSFTVQITRTLLIKVGECSLPFSSDSFAFLLPVEKCKD